MTKPLGEVTASDLVRSLASTVCPSCGQAKRRRQTLCGREYYKLNAAEKAALYRRVGCGYEAAFSHALGVLRRPVVHLPDVPTPSIEPVTPNPR